MSLALLRDGEGGSQALERVMCLEAEVSPAEPQKFVQCSLRLNDLLPPRFSGRGEVWGGGELSGIYVFAASPRGYRCPAIRSKCSRPFLKILMPLRLPHVPFRAGMG